MNETADSGANTATISEDGFGAMNSEQAGGQYGQPMAYEVHPSHLTPESHEHVGKMDAEFRQVFSELSIPAESGKRILQLYAKSYGNEPMGEPEAVELNRWLDDTPAVANAAWPMLEQLAGKFGTSAGEFVEHLNLGLNETKYFLSELAILALDSGLDS